jgi:hypothetical protein
MCRPGAQIQAKMFNITVFNKEKTKEAFFIQR